MVIMSRRQRWSLMPLLAILVFFLQTTVFAQEQANSAFKELRQILKIENPTDKIAALKDFAVKYPETNNKLHAYSTILDTYRSNLKDFQQAEAFAREILAQENDLKLKQLAYNNLLSIYQKRMATNWLT